MTPTASTDLHLYFDYISPNAYLAWKQLPALARRFRRRVVPVPVLYPGLLGAHGLLGPMEVPPKARWMKKDILRKTRRLGIPFAPPPSHPFNPLLALRVSSLPMPEDTLVRLINELFDATWGGGPGVTDPGTVAALAAEAGLDGPEAVVAAGRQEAKDLLRRRTEDAVRDGIFGVPTVQVGEELFWGFDDFGSLERYLSGSDDLDEATLQSWHAIRPSAQRHPKP
jgi:2-hydroxychromene-2-carboxylate isomerase